MYKTDAENDQFLKTAHSIGKHLITNAIRVNDQCNWIGSQVDIVNNKYETVSKACGPDLYSGLSGIAHFLAELYSKTENAILFSTLQSAVNTILFQFKESSCNNFGLFSGKLGIGFTLWKVGTLTKQKEWKEKGLSILKELENQKTEDHEIDIVSGAAGAIPALIQVFNAEKDDTYINIAIRCGEFLLDIAEKTEEYWSWKTIADEKYNLVGFSHGTAGISMALLELFYATNDEKFWTGSMMGFRYEQKWFSPEKGNWPDLRSHESEKELIYGDMWCHGAAGIALSRIRAYKLTGLQVFYDEAVAALNTTYSNIVTMLNDPQNRFNYSLCHGIAGNADILLYGGQQLENPQFVELAHQVGKRGIELYENNEISWPSGVTDPTGLTAGQEETPGLMLGLAGTGLFYLRLYDKNVKTALITTPEI